jgi:uncharacterized damage-inducible protein DinB
MSAIDELNTIREHLERYRSVTLQTLELVPDEKLDWRPAAGLRSFAEQFLHIAQTEEFYTRGLFSDDWNMTSYARPATAITRELVLNKLAEVRTYSLARLAELEPSQLGSAKSVPGIPVPWPLRGWLWYLVEHEVHHKAQLSLYLREIGITPPFFAAALPPGVRPDIRPDVM